MYTSLRGHIHHIYNRHPVASYSDNAFLYALVLYTSGTQGHYYVLNHPGTGTSLRYVPRLEKKNTSIRSQRLLTLSYAYEVMLMRNTGCVKGKKIPAY